MTTPTDQAVIDALQSIANVLTGDCELDRLTGQRLDAHDAAIASLKLGMDAISEAMATRADLDDAVLQIRDRQAS